MRNFPALLHTFAVPLTGFYCGLILPGVLAIQPVAVGMIPPEHITSYSRVVAVQWSPWGQKTQFQDY